MVTGPCTLDQPPTAPTRSVGGRAESDQGAGRIVRLPVAVHRAQWGMLISPAVRIGAISFRISEKRRFVVAMVI